MISSHIQKLWSTLASNISHLNTYISNVSLELSLSSVISYVIILFVIGLIALHLTVVLMAITSTIISSVINLKHIIRIIIAWTVVALILWFLVSHLILFFSHDLSVRIMEPLFILPRKMSVEGFDAAQVGHFIGCFKNALLMSFQQDLHKTSWSILDVMWKFECFDLGHFDIMDALLKERASGSDYDSHIMSRTDVIVSPNSDPNMHFNNVLLTKLLENRIGSPFVTL